MKIKIASIITALIVIIGIFMLFSCTTRVPAGYIGVKYNMSGGVQDDVLTQGWHVTSPTVKVTLYTVSLEQSYLTSDEKGDSKDDESFSASSSEGKALQIDLTFTYQYKADDVVGVFTRFKGQDGTTIRDNFIKPNIISWSKEIIAKYKVSDILGSERTTVNNALTEYLSSKFADYGITISNVSLINIDVDAETQKAISAKITAQQNADTQAINNQMAIDKAEAEAKAKLIEAQAEADAELIKAEAEAEANKKLSQSLTPELIDKMKIDKWNGDVPQVSGNSTNIVDLTGCD